MHQDGLSVHDQMCARVDAQVASEWLEEIRWKTSSESSGAAGFGQGDE